MTERQSPYNPPLNHCFKTIRDAVEPNFFTVYPLAGEPFRIYSPEFARQLDDREERRFEGIPEYEGDGDFPDLEEILTERRLNRPPQEVMEEEAQALRQGTEDGQCCP